VPNPGNGIFFKQLELFKLHDNFWMSRVRAWTPACALFLLGALTPADAFWQSRDSNYNIAISASASCSIGSPASVQHATTTQLTTGTTISVTLTSPVTRCNALFITTLPINHSVGSPVTSISCTDDKSNTYTFVDTVDASDAYGMQTAWLGGISNSPSTITCTMTGGAVNASFLMAEEVSGLGSSPTLDGHSILTQSGATTYTSGSAVTVTAGDFLYSPVISSASIALTPGSGFTGSINTVFSTLGSVFTEYKSPSTTSAQATWGSTGAADRADVALLAIKPGR
jgi:hypothetical protein